MKSVKNRQPNPVPPEVRDRLCRQWQEEDDITRAGQSIPSIVISRFRVPILPGATLALCLLVNHIVPQPNGFWWGVATGALCASVVGAVIYFHNRRIWHEDASARVNDARRVADTYISMRMRLPGRQ